MSGLSGQWEVVGKKKEKNSKQLPQKVNSKENKKKNVIKETKVEDVCMYLFVVYFKHMLYNDL